MAETTKRMGLLTTQHGRACDGKPARAPRTEQVQAWENEGGALKQQLGRRQLLPELQAHQEDATDHPETKRPRFPGAFP
jgi:hypothetical protein